MDVRNISIIIFLSAIILSVWIGVLLYRKIFGRHLSIELFKLSIKFPDLSIIKAILSEIDFPYALDFTVENLGSEINTYISIDDRNINRLKKFLSDKKIDYSEFDDYLAFNSYGVWDVLVSNVLKDNLLSFDFRMVDFSAVNSIGESGVLRIVNHPDEESFIVEILASASNDFPMREIRDTLAAPFKNFGLERPKNIGAFFKKFNSPDYLR